MIYLVWMYGKPLNCVESVINKIEMNKIEKY